MTGTSATPRAILAAILLLALALRGFEAAPSMRFTGDEARDVLQAKNVTARGELPRLGPKIHRGEGNLGPGYAYLMALPLLAADYDPAGALWTVIAFDVAAVALVHAIGSLLFGALAGLLAAFLYAVSFPFVFYARWCWHPSLVPFFALLLMFCVLRLDSGRRRFAFAAGASFAILVQLHLSTVLLAVPLAVGLAGNARSLGRRGGLAVAFGLLVPSLPLLWHELSTGFLNVRRMLRVGTVLTAGNDESMLRFLGDVLQVIGDRTYWSYGRVTPLVDGFEWMYGINVVLCSVAIGVAALRLRGRPRDALAFVAWALPPCIALLAWGGRRQQYYLLFWLPVHGIAVAALLAWLGRGHVVRRVVAVACVALLATVGLRTYAADLERVRRPDYDGFLAGPLREKKAAVDAVVEDAGAAPYDLLIVSWDWSNQRPFAYLFGNEGRPPRETRMIVGGPANPGISETHFIDTSESFRVSTGPAAERTYVIAEPDAPTMFAGARRVAGSAQVAVYRLPGPVGEHARLEDRGS